MFVTPILLITFNRPDHVRQVLTEIRKQQPAQLFVCQDGARDGNENDYVKCQEVRDVIAELVDWPCELHTLYQDQNLGCGPGPAAGITWFFEHVEMGIVMEDDCLPHPDFFGYCEEMLNHFKDDDSISMINSTLYYKTWKCDASYGFSHFMVTGAWAGWRRTWKGFDLDMHTWQPWQFRRQVKRLTKSTTEANWWYWKLKEIQADTTKKSYWDYQMQMLLFQKGALTIHPQKNLISNIGFDADGTHTLTNDGRGNLEVHSILPLTHPIHRNVDCIMDVGSFGQTHIKSWYVDIIQFIYNYMNKSEGIIHSLLILYKKIKKNIEA